MSWSRGRVKVADFGVAKAVGEKADLNRTVTVVGNPANIVTTLIYQILLEDPLANPPVSTAVGEKVTAFLRRYLEKAPERRIPDEASFAAGARAVVASVAFSDPVTTAQHGLTISTGPMPTWRRARLVVPARLAALRVLAAVGAVAVRYGGGRAVPDSLAALTPPPPLAAATPVHRAGALVRRHRDPFRRRSRRSLPAKPGRSLQARRSRRARLPQGRP
jgi:hypothetical protein